MGAGGDLSTLPVPTDARVRLRVVPPAVMAVLRAAFGSVRLPSARGGVLAHDDPRFPAQAGQPATVTLDMTQAHFFDPDSGIRL